jgi:phospholipase/carboxylesterase
LSRPVCGTGYFLQQGALRGGSCRSREDRVVAADVADDFRPAATIQRERHPLRRSDGRFYDQQIGSRGREITQEILDARDLALTPRCCARQFVSLSRFHRAETFQIAADARLRGVKALRGEGIHEILLRGSRRSQEHLANGFASLCLHIGRYGHRINMHITMTSCAYPVKPDLLLPSRFDQTKETHVQIPDCVEVELGQAKASVIWLHGLGADGHDFEPIVPELGFSPDSGIRFLFPHAPMRPVTINGGTRMRAWYDIRTFDRDGPQDEAGIRESALLLERLIERERQRGSAYERIVVAGFSQGGAIALHTALRFPRRLAGLMALSTWLPLAQSFREEVAEKMNAVSRELPIFMAHGSVDPVLPMEFGKSSREALENAGFDVEWHEYPMGHAVCAEEISAVSRWLQSVLSREAQGSSC